MEKNESPWRLNSASAFVLIETMNFSAENNPLFSCIITLYTLILLYFPNGLKLSFPPILILTAVCLLFLLRLGAVERLKTSTPEKDNDKEASESRESKGNDASSSNEGEMSCLVTRVDKKVSSQTATGPNSGKDPDYKECFLEWNVRAPLEVIYEAYEGEEDYDDPNGNSPVPNEKQQPYYQLPSYPPYYPETDSDSSSDGGLPVAGQEWESLERNCFKWEEENIEDLMIEISLENKKETGWDLGLGSGSDASLLMDEDNLIEIDISPRKNDNALLSDSVVFN